MDTLPLDTVHDIVKWVIKADKKRLYKPVWRQDYIYFMRFVAAYPRLARDVAIQQKWYQSITTKIIVNPFSQYTMLCGRYHSFADNPAVHTFCEGKTTKQDWYRYGVLHRDNGSARVEYWPDRIDSSCYDNGIYVGIHSRRVRH